MKRQIMVLRMFAATQTGTEGLLLIRPGMTSKDMYLEAWSLVIQHIDVYPSL